MAARLAVPGTSEARKEAAERKRISSAPAQDAAEFAQFLALLRDNGVRRYLEIGARHGGSFNAVMRSLPPGSFGLTIDLPGVAWGRDDSEPVLRRVVADLCRDGYQAELILGSSQDSSVIAAAARHAPYDAVFIDGDHSLVGVMADWINYGKMSRIVALHDIAGDNVTTKRTPIPVEVPQAWQQIKSTEQGTAHEFITDARHWGIGVIVRA